MKDDKSRNAGPEPHGMTPFKKGVLALLVLLFVGSVVARAFVVGDRADPAPAAQRAPGVGPDGFLPGVGPQAAEAPAPEEERGLESLLPVFTEGSFFALLGFALGYATKKIVKLLLIGVALFFVAIQGLVYADVMTVDWGHLIELVNTSVLNLQEGQPFTEILKEKVPTVGALVAGYFLGFRRG